MNARKFVIVVCLAFLSAGLAASLRPPAALAQCGLPGTPPCEPKKKRPTETPRQSATSTSTFTPAATVTQTPTATGAPTKFPTPTKLMCLDLEQFKKCIGNPQCNGLPLCPGQVPTSKPQGLSPIPAQPYDFVLLSILLIGLLLAGGLFAARRNFSKRYVGFGHSVKAPDGSNSAPDETHTDEHGRVKEQFHWDRTGQPQDDDGLSDAWEEHGNVDANEDGEQPPYKPPPDSA